MIEARAGMEGRCHSIAPPPQSRPWGRGVGRSLTQLLIDCVSVCMFCLSTTTLALRAIKGLGVIQNKRFG